jgi:hypothetical protein
VLCDDAAWPDVPRTEQPNFSQCRIVPYRNGDEEGMSDGAELETNVATEPEVIRCAVEG